MKISNCQLDIALQRHLSPPSKLLEMFVLRTSGPIIRNDILQFNVSKFRKEQELLCLAVYSWYLGRDLGALLRVDLEERCEVQNPDFKIKLSLALFSKSSAFDILISSMSDSDFFGNFLRFFEKTTSRLAFIRSRQRKAKREERHRGYRDHGSRTQPDRWLPDGQMPKLQYQIEQERILQNDAKQFLYGFCGAI